LFSSISYRAEVSPLRKTGGVALESLTATFCRFKALKSELMGEKMSRTTHFRASLGLAQSRLTYARQELERAEKNHNPDDVRGARSLRKLATDVQRAQSDVAWLQKRLDDLMD
jgi:hypothetical protein